MKFVNQKTCDGIETFLYLRGGLTRLSLVPELLRSLPQKEAVEIRKQLEKLEPARTGSPSSTG